MDSDDSDQRLEHKREPASYLDLETLYKKTGVEYFKVDFIKKPINDLAKVALITFFDVHFLQINADNYENDEVLKELRSKRGYTYEDQVGINNNTRGY